ncbi:hypothetical protein GGX14DRAFT_563478 [Mycena pura]|uniref:Uncharacterized protein n=1 Tax=Mycena pura TaxID=153505 RepID=A0AAD6VLY6_9AGAR|nr:hypothetical protein GGX14DRAFT_563478 [Mycena pura]
MLYARRPPLHVSAPYACTPHARAPPLRKHAGAAVHPHNYRRAHTYAAATSCPARPTHRTRPPRRYARPQAPYMHAATRRRTPRSLCMPRHCTCMHAPLHALRTVCAPRREQLLQSAGCRSRRRARRVGSGTGAGVTGAEHGGTERGAGTGTGCGAAQQGQWARAQAQCGGQGACRVQEAAGARAPGAVGRGRQRRWAQSVEGRWGRWGRKVWWIR